MSDQRLMIGPAAIVVLALSLGLWALIWLLCVSAVNAWISPWQ